MKPSFRKTFRFLFWIIVGCLTVALWGQVYAFFHPGYSNIILVPERQIGWKLAPDISFIHTGDHWYANELSVRHTTNSLGFLGPERNPLKESTTLRVAVFGDSLIEALQVPYRNNSSNVLERILNHSELLETSGYTNAEVMNFGVSNLSVGQYLLIWEEYARKFSPDYVFVFVAGEQMRRTVQRTADWGVKISRPAFDLDNGSLVRYPMKGAEEWRRELDIEIAERGGRSIKRPQQVWIWDWIQSGDMQRIAKRLIPAQIRLSFKQLFTEDTKKPLRVAITDKMKSLFGKGSTAAAAPAVEPELEMEEHVLNVNLAVLKEMNRQVRTQGGTMVILDASLYYWFQGANEVLPTRLKAFSEANGIGYVPVYQDLLETDKNNIWARFPHSHHFNEHGNAIIARNMSVWVEKQLTKTESK